MFIDYYPASWTLDDLCQLLTLEGWVKPPVALKSTYPYNRQLDNNNTKFGHAAFESEAAQNEVIRSLSGISIHGRVLKVEAAESDSGGKSRWRWNSFSAAFKEEWERWPAQGRGAGSAHGDSSRSAADPSRAAGSSSTGHPSQARSVGTDLPFDQLELVPIAPLRRFRQVWISNLPPTIDRATLVNFFGSRLPPESIIGVVIQKGLPGRHVGKSLTLLLSDGY